MKKNLVYALMALSIVVFIGFVALNYGSLPQDMPMQIGLTGNVNWTLPKPLAIGAMGVLLIAVSVQFYFHFRTQENAGLKESLVVILLPVLMTAFVWFSTTLN